MKKIFILALCLVLLLTACSEKGDTYKPTELNEDNYASYVGAGEMTLINILVNSNAEFVNEVFKKNHLPIDEKSTIQKGADSFAPVVSDKYKTLADLKEHLSSIYMEKSVDNILNNPPQYVDIDGKLYFNMKYAESDYHVDWSSPAVSASINDEGKYEIIITVKDKNGNDYTVTGHATAENGSLKLENFYY